jgi:hypothetical protein
MVETAFIGGPGRPTECEVPLEEVRFEGFGCVVWGGGVADLGGFSYCCRTPVSLLELGGCYLRVGVKE